MLKNKVEKMVVDYEEEDELDLALRTLETELQLQQALAWQKAKKALEG
ncbi:MAG: hypothetical protein LBV63_01515 [Candidatus Methanoplasma sp.]|nr:hypothetical protein [Candidatus Methanoplasma sp.]